MTDNVVPLRRRRQDDPPPEPDYRVSKAVRRAPPAAREVAVQQNADGKQRYATAAARQEAEGWVAAGKVVPARITIALDLRGLEGPEVDEECGTFEGNPDGDVDRWELAIAVPTREQVELLAKLTNFPVPWFYKPLPPGPLLGDGPIWICWGGRRGCEASAPDVVDERGVLLYEGKPRTLPDAVQGALPIPGGELTNPGPELEKRPPPRKKTAAARKKTPPPAEQPTLPNRMPEHLRADLVAKGILGR
jgi:hypothetical protein